MKTILFATDDSESATEALEFAIDLAKEVGASLEVLAVRPPRMLGKAGAAPHVLEIEEPHGAQDIAARTAGQAAAAGVGAHAHVAQGHVADAIISEAERLHADLIVVGSRGLGGVSSAVLGSVSRRLISHSKIPVTVVKSTVRAHAHV